MNIDLKSFWFVENDKEKKFSKLIELKDYLSTLKGDDRDKLNGLKLIHVKNGKIVSYLEMEVVYKCVFFGYVTKFKKEEVYNV